MKMHVCYYSQETEMFCFLILTLGQLVESHWALVYKNSTYFVVLLQR